MCAIATTLAHIATTLTSGLNIVLLSNNIESMAKIQVKEMLKEFVENGENAMGNIEQHVSAQVIAESSLLFIYLFCYPDQTTHGCLFRGCLGCV